MNYLSELVSDFDIRSPSWRGKQEGLDGHPHKSEAHLGVRHVTVENEFECGSGAW